MAQQPVPHTDLRKAGLAAAMVVGLLLAVEYLLLEPIKREVERWREVSS